MDGQHASFGAGAIPPTAFATELRSQASQALNPEVPPFPPGAYIICAICAIHR